MPYSGTTGPAGIIAPLAYVAGWTIPIDGTALAGALADPASFTQSLSSSLEATLLGSGAALAGRIVVFELPRLALSLSTLAGTTLAVNDPKGTLQMNDVLERDDLSSMLVMPAMLTALGSAGAVGGVAVLDEPEEGVRGEYAPFFGTITPNLPAVYVDRDTGALAKTIASGAPLITASEAFAAGFSRTIVATPPVLGEGPNFRPLPLIQFITMPLYLLLANLPVTAQLTDFDLMQRQVLGFVAMEQSLATAPAAQLGVSP